MAKPALLTVLVVDDDPAMLRWASEVLRQAGMKPVTAGDPSSALALVRAAQPGVVVLDLGLPAGGGKMFLERLRKFRGFATLPVLVMSGRVTPEVTAELEPLGVTTLLEKPVDPQRFVTAVRQAAAPAESAPE